MGATPKLSPNLRSTNMCKIDKFNWRRLAARSLVFLFPTIVVYICYLCGGNSFTPLLIAIMAFIFVLLLFAAVVLLFKLLIWIIDNL